MVVAFFTFKGLTDVDLARYFRFSFSDLQGLFSRRTVILILMAVLLYQTTGVFYRALTLQLLRMTPPPAAEIQVQEAVAAIREPLDAYRPILDRNIFGTTQTNLPSRFIYEMPQEVLKIQPLFESNYFEDETIEY